MSAFLTGRRRMVAGLGATALSIPVTGPADGATTAMCPDANLLDACARFHVANTQHDLLHIAGAISDDDAGDVVTEWVAAREKVAGIQPRTPEGLQAKAHVAFIVLREQACTRSWTQTPWQKQLTAAERMALECLAAVAGRAEA